MYLCQSWLVSDFHSGHGKYGGFQCQCINNLTASSGRGPYWVYFSNYTFILLTTAGQRSWPGFLISSRVFGLLRVHDMVRLNQKGVWEGYKKKRHSTSGFRAHSKYFTKAKHSPSTYLRQWSKPKFNHLPLRIDLQTQQLYTLRPTISCRLTLKIPTVLLLKTILNMPRS